MLVHDERISPPRLEFINVLLVQHHERSNLVHHLLDSLVVLQGRLFFLLSGDFMNDIL